ncbi:MAG: class B sortase, partial [Oscillospiraceae bacterium]|nr:class B sortase [Oscillospiraceae bacterium]
MLTVKPRFQIRLLATAFCIGLVVFSTFGMIRQHIRANMAAEERYDLIQLHSPPPNMTEWEPGRVPEAEPPPPGLTREQIVAQNRLRFADMLAINPDFQGFLYFPGQPDMHWPFVMGQDNDFYLNRDFHRRVTHFGAIFADYRGYDYFGWNKNNVLYGHNMRDGQMFGRLLRYDYNIEHFNNFPFMMTDALSGHDAWVIFAVYRGEAEWGYIQQNFGDDYERLQWMLDEIQRRSQIQVNFDVSVHDTFITLSTCEYDFEDARFVVHARRLRPGESGENGAFAANPPRAERNTNIQGPNITLIGLDEVNRDMLLPTIWTNPQLRRYFLTYVSEWGIEYYSSNDNVRWQPRFLAFRGEINMRRFTWLSTFRDGRDYWIATNGLDGDTPGISLLHARTPAGPFERRGGAITPQGVDAQYPLLTMVGGRMRLVYINRFTGQMEVINSSGGEATRMMETPAHALLRPMAHFAANGGYYLIWSEVIHRVENTGAGFQNVTHRNVFIAFSYNGVDEWQEPVVLPLQEIERLVIYQSTRGERRMLIQSLDGSLRDQLFNNAWLPSSRPPIAEQTPEPTPTPEPEPTPTPTPEPTPTPTPEPEPTPTPTP